MSYKTYTTEAIVCGSRVNNTSDKSFLLFTKDAGMLWAAAKSVREERSRQRFALQDFSLIRASLIKGKSGWRIGSVESDRNYFTGEGDSGSARKARATATGILRLARQFLHGEVGHPQIFDDIKQALMLSKEATSEDNQRIFDIFTLRFLHQLGYIANDPAFTDYLTSEQWYELPPLPTKAVDMIDRAKEASHL